MISRIAGLADIVRVHGREPPDAPALVVGGRTITFERFD